MLAQDCWILGGYAPAIISRMLLFCSNMKRTHALLALLLFMLVTFTARQAAAQANAANSCPDLSHLAGTYVSDYGFSIEIPKGLEGASTQSCSNESGGCTCYGGDNGIIINLAKGLSDEDHYIEAYGDVDGFDEPALKTAINVELDSVQRRSLAKSVLILRRSDVTLGGVKGERLVIRYRDKKSRRIMIEDSVLALKRLTNGGYGEWDYNEYSITLSTPVRSYHRDIRIFEQMLRSFVSMECDYC